MIRILHGDCMEQLRTLPSGSVHTVVTSPPYFGLRDYGIPPSVWGGAPDCVHDFVPVPKRHRGGPPGAGAANEGRDRTAQATVADIYPGEFCASCDAWRGCLGLEPSLALFVEHMVAVFDELWRVLRADGTVWLNLGDSYASTPTGSNSTTSRLEGGQATQIVGGRRPNKVAGNFKAKDLLGVPWRVAFALQDYGWYLRQDIIWAKPNPMPESVRDRCTKAHEYLFHLAKSERYYFDAEAIAEPISEGSAARVLQPNFDEQQGGPKDYGTTGVNANRSMRGTIENFALRVRSSMNKARKSGDERGRPGSHLAGSVPWEGCTRNKRSVWTVSTKPYKEAHFATFPPELVEPCIAAGTSEHGCCSSCGAPYVRLLEDAPDYAEFKRAIKERCGAMRSSELETFGLTRGTTNPGVSPERVTTGWAPGCGCGTGLSADDLEIINTPTGERAGEDPSLVTGRAGMDRPRGENEGSRPITRYEQRRYAEQLKASAHREEMRAAAGEAFAHYERTDRSGARPIPPDLLFEWLERGWLELVELPEYNPPPVVPCTVLDPFGGSGTTGLVADRMQRHAVLIEINPAYVEMARTRLEGDAPLFAEVRT